LPNEAQSKGYALIKTTGDERQPFFPNAARSGVTAGVMFECMDADARKPPLPRSLANVRRILM